MGKFEYGLVAAMALLISGVLGLIVLSPDAVMEETGVDLERTGVPGGLTFAAPDDAPRMVPVAAADDAMDAGPGGEPRIIELGAADSLMIGEAGPPSEAAPRESAPVDASGETDDGIEMSGGEMPVIEATDTVEIGDEGSEQAAGEESGGNTIEASDTVIVEDG